MRWIHAAVLATVALTSSGCGDGEEGSGDGNRCVAPEPPAEAVRKVGTTDGVTLLPGGRALSPAGTETVVGDFPANVQVHPTLNVAYVANTGFDKRALRDPPADRRSASAALAAPGELVAGPPDLVGSEELLENAQPLG